MGARIGAAQPLAQRIDDLVLYFVEHPEIARLSLHHLLGESPFPREIWRPYFDEMRTIDGSGQTQEGVDPEMLAQVLMAVALLWPLSARTSTRYPAGGGTQRFAASSSAAALLVLRPERCPDWSRRSRPRWKEEAMSPLDFDPFRSELPRIRIRPTRSAPAGSVYG